jgi:ABC-2 type transport system permease protein
VRLLLPTLVSLELGKWFHLSSVRFSALLLTLMPLMWAYAPGIFDVYGVFVVSGFQVPALSLLSGMEFLFPLLTAIISAELLGVEISHGTLRAMLLRPVSRTQWLLGKLLVALIMPFMLLGFVLLVSLLAGLAFGYGPFVGGTGLGAGGLVGEGLTAPGAALLELLRAYSTAAFSLVPVSLLSLLLTVMFMNTASGALATLGILIVSGLFIVFPGVSPYLLTTQLDAYLLPAGGAGLSLAMTGAYALVFAVAAVVMFERKDF